MNRTCSSLTTLIVALLAASMFAGPASADSATISVTDAGGGQMRATVQATSTSCSGYGYCGWFGFVLERHSSLPCRDEETFLRHVIPLQEAAGTREETFTFRSFFPRMAKLCVYLENGVGVPLAGEALYAMPSGYGDQRGTGYNCPDFGSQSAAEYYLELYPGDPSRLDADHDGAACEDNKCPCGADPIPPEPEPTLPAITGIEEPEASAACREARRNRQRSKVLLSTAQRHLGKAFSRGSQRYWRQRLRQRRVALQRAEQRAEEACG